MAADFDNRTVDLASQAKTPALTPETREALQLQNDLAVGLPAMNRMIIGVRRPIDLLRETDVYGNTPTEQAVARVLQRAMNDNLQAQGSPHHVAIDGVIEFRSANERGAKGNGEISSHEALEEILTHINRKRGEEFQLPFPEGRVRIGPKLIAALAENSPMLIDDRYPLSPNISAEDLRTLRPVLANERHLHGVESDTLSTPILDVVRRLAKTALSEEKAKHYDLEVPSNPSKLSAFAQEQRTSDLRYALGHITSPIDPSPVDAIGPNTIAKLLLSAALKDEASSRKN